MFVRLASRRFGGGNSLRLNELSVVTLTHSLEHRARELPEGTPGTIVHAWSDGEHYEVEFTRPFTCVVSLALADVEPA
jgi:hypothetical protein